MISALTFVKEVFSGCRPSQKRLSNSYSALKISGSHYDCPLTALSTLDNKS